MVIQPPRPLPRPETLADLLAAVGVPRPPAPADGVAASGVAMDSRLVLPGDIYVAIGGAAAHGAQFVAQAQAAGAVAVVTDAAGAELCAGSALPVVVVPDPRALAGPLASAAYGHPSAGLLVVGITGTNGKTTMTFLLESVLRAAGHRTGVLGTTGHLVAGRRLPSERTTPEAVEVHAILGHMRDEGVTAVVMEVSSHAMAFGRVNGVDFDAAVFTNLTQDHLDFHGTMEEYFRAKAGLFEVAGTQVICVDDQWGRRLAAAHPGATTYGVVEPSAQWRAGNAVPAGSGSDFDVLAPGARAGIAAHVGLPGAFNVANALGAIACAHALGVSTQTAVTGVAACEGVPGRMQAVRNERGLRAYVDYAHTPDAVERAIAATPGRVVVVLGCGGDRDAGKRPLMGAAAARLAHKVIVTDDNPRSEEPSAIRAAVMGGALEVPEADRAEVVEVADRRSAIREAVASARPGDAVLVLGKGHEQGQTVGGTTFPFDDAAELAAALEVPGA